VLEYNDLILAFQELKLNDKVVVAHASLRAFGEISGGADSIVTALLYTLGALIMPAHTYKTMVTPASGPANNAVNYARAQQWNRLAEPYQADMPADVMMGVVPEHLRHRPQVKRSPHPILSFVGANAEKILKSQTLANPLAPLMEIANADGWVLLLGVDHTANTVIHLAEKLAKRKQFTRWALTESGNVICPGFPGCSAGFEAIEPALRPQTITIQAGQAVIRAVPVRAVIVKTIEAIQKNPLALLCDRADCERCAAVREGLAGSSRCFTGSKPKPPPGLFVLAAVLYSSSFLAFYQRHHSLESGKNRTRIL
jgi:aminoglycoside 3-N-acetyltransferase